MVTLTVWSGIAFMPSFTDPQTGAGDGQQETSPRHLFQGKQMTHTPGPWHKRNVTEIWGGPDKHIASTKNRSMDKGLIHHEIAANARLIGAAPELLEALKEIDFIAKMAPADELPELDCVVLAHVRAAIAKATGEANG